MYNGEFIETWKRYDNICENEAKSVKWMRAGEKESRS